MGTISSQNNDVKYDDLIKSLSFKIFPEVSWLLIKAQIHQESLFNSKAESPSGAKGLMQLMDKTAEEMECDFPFDPKENITAGLKYLSIQYHHFPEVPSPDEKIKFALASYNGGRGYVNKALELARKSRELPENYYEWYSMGGPTGLWQLWEYTKTYLSSPQCVVHSKFPDHKQMIDYVHKIICKFKEYSNCPQIRRNE